MWVLSLCISTRLSSTVTMRQGGIKRFARVTFPPNRADPEKAQHLILSLLIIKASFLILWAHYECAAGHIWGDDSPQPTGTSSLYRYIEKVHSHAILNRIYCPRLAPYMVGQEYIYKKSVLTRLLDHIKAQMVKAVTWERCRRVTYVQKNCTC